MLKIMRHHPQSFANVPHVPLFVAEQANTRLIQWNWMDFSGEKFEKGRLARPVRADDRRMLSLVQGEGKVNEDATFSPIDRSMLDVKDRMHDRASSSPKLRAR